MQTISWPLQNFSIYTSLKNNQNKTDLFISQEKIHATSSDFKYIWNTWENIHMHPGARTTETEVEIRGKKWIKSQQTLEGFISVWMSALWISNALDVRGIQSKYIFFMEFSIDCSLIYLCIKKITSRMLTSPHSAF